MAMWSNYHSHSKYCDGKGELEDYIVAAKKNRLVSMGFSSHAPVPFDCKWCMKKEDLPAYLDEIDRLATIHRDLEIYKSLEIDYVPGAVSPQDYRNDLDYLLGSIHFVERFPDGRPWEIDNAPSVFEEGLREVFRDNAKDAVVRYFALTREMIETSSPDIIGHLDKIKMQNRDQKYFKETDAWYQHEVKETLKLIRKAELIVEVNTRGLYQKKTDTPYPSPWILEHIHREKIPVTISSDAHNPDDLVNRFEEMAMLLMKIGFKTITVFRGGVWKQIPFHEAGLVS